MENKLNWLQTNKNGYKLKMNFNKPGAPVQT